jgi:small subunit ribosomal protein S8
MLSDPIADMLTRLRNALAARHPKVDVPASKLKTEIARILKEEGYILNYKVAEEGPKKTIKIYLKYATNTEPVISHIERVSRPVAVCMSAKATSRACWAASDQHPDDPARRDDRSACA